LLCGKFMRSKPVTAGNKAAPQNGLGFVDAGSHVADGFGSYMAMRLNTTSVPQVHSRDLVPSSCPPRRRRYALRAVKQRLHPTSFRMAIIIAYNGRFSWIAAIKTDFPGCLSFSF
jgi:hypothetical protein